MTRYLHRELLDHVLGVGAYSPPSARYLALFTVAPSSTGGGTECADANYARQSIGTFNAATDADPAAGTNNAAVTFPAMAASQTIVAVGIFDALTGGNLLFWVLASFTAGVGVQVQFAAGNLSCQLTYSPS
ncbi:MAG: hypothetical protein KA369_08365 [Spirochaetes bacterium]|nr:hypothetical protein [Spirochaetota bacterium]